MLLSLCSDLVHCQLHAVFVVPHQLKLKTKFVTLLQCLYVAFSWYSRREGNICQTVPWGFSTRRIWRRIYAQIAKFMGPTWGPPGSCRPQMGPMLAPRTLPLGWIIKYPLKGRYCQAQHWDCGDLECGLKTETLIFFTFFIFIMSPSSWYFNRPLPPRGVRC